jgi:predicted secreted hydrolase
MTQDKPTLRVLPGTPVMPKDQYAHRDPDIGPVKGKIAPTEWWWHIGTVKSSDGRVFGFEVNAASFTDYCFTQIQITDIANQHHYQMVAGNFGTSPTWAEYDSTKPWFVKLPGMLGGANGAVSMTAIDGDPMHMFVKADFNDNLTGTPCSIELQMKQEGPPMLVWGTGVKEMRKIIASPLQKNNYYYSLTNLQTEGTLIIGGVKTPVSGVTWMDHEYGLFPRADQGHKLPWILQDIQLENGFQMSNYAILLEGKPEVDVPMKSTATVFRDGKSTYMDTTTTPMAPVFISKKGMTYFLKFKVEINQPDLKATFMVESLCPDQLFTDEHADVYEGIGSCSAQFGNIDVVVTGTAWIEENL